MTNWGNILQDSSGRNAIKNFALGELNCEEVQKVFRSKGDREVSGAVRNLIRTKGTKAARQVARKALQRRNLL